MSERSIAAVGSFAPAPWSQVVRRAAVPQRDEDPAPTDGTARASVRAAGPAPDAGAAPSARLAIVQWIACSLLVAIPFLAVRFPPIADLPQQSAQLRLLHDALQDPA